MVNTRSHVRAQTRWIALIDVLCLIAGGMIGVLLRFGPEDVSEYVFGHLEGWLLARSEVEERPACGQ